MLKYLDIKNKQIRDDIVNQLQVGFNVDAIVLKKALEEVNPLIHIYITATKTYYQIDDKSTTALGLAINSDLKLS